MNALWLVLSWALQLRQARPQLRSARFCFLSLRPLPWLADRPEIAYPLFRYLGIFLSPFSIVVREDHLSDLSCFQLVSVCLIARNVPCLTQCPWASQGCRLCWHCASRLRVPSARPVSWDALAGGAFSFPQPWFPVEYFRQLQERSSEVFRCNCGFD